MVDEALLRAIRIIGSRRELLQWLEISPERLNAWLNRGVGMGLEYALAIQHLTQGQVTAEELVPAKLHVLKKMGIGLPHTHKK